MIKLGYFFLCMQMEINENDETKCVVKYTCINFPTNIFSTYSFIPVIL